MTADWDVICDVDDRAVLQNIMRGGGTITTPVFVISHHSFAHYL